ncbi:MAG: acetamidase/formamidase family protein [Bryobacteraceae bacterium]|nr:acetamidase/formamidase family protein [Bryobacteraceae bacterium]MDW8378225.1 acetamidase/formamidase family protein [Bryobacterales bacterium]
MRRLVVLGFATAIGLIAADHRVVNEVNYHTFSTEHPIQARLRSGDRVITKTVDSAGFDLHGVRHTKTHGNPLTGPFFIEGAEPGDAIAVHLERVRLNRTTGYTAFQVGALTPGAKTKYAPPPYEEGAVLPGRTDLIPFVLDVKTGSARPKRPLSKRLDLQFRAVPMLGCIGVAPGMEPAPTSGPAGSYGGNLDYKEVREGTTVLLPVFVPGAFLFVGDGHALQGDGEAVGSGIETSLDVQFTVTLRKNARLTNPRLENSEFLISLAARTSSQPAWNELFALANSDMLRWLVEEYDVEPVAAHLLIGHEAKYDVAALSGVLAVRIPKRALSRKAQP